MSEPVFRASSEFPDEDLARLFTASYEGYYTPITLDAVAFRSVSSLWDVDLGASRVALLDGTPAGLVQLGIRGERGWIGGMGVIREFRGRGLGRALMDAALESAEERSLSSVDLEVLVQNAHAIPVYEACGFRTTRRLLVLTRAAESAPPPEADPVEPLDPTEVLRAWDELHAQPNPWQRGRASLERQLAKAEARGVRSGGRILASVIALSRPGSAAILDVGFARGAPLEALRRSLVATVAANAATSQMLLNLPDDDPSAAVLEALGFARRFEQLEMTRPMSR